MAFLLHHIEKLILGLLLLGVLACFAMLLSDQKAAREEVAKIESEDPTARRQKMVEQVLPEQFNALDALEGPQLRWGKERTEEDKNVEGVFIPMSLIYCADLECGNILPYKQEKCPFCGKDQGPQDGEGPAVIVDRDGDGIADEFEYKYDFLDPKVEGDAERDHDEDYFTNLEEYLGKTDPADKASHPPLANKLRLAGVKKDRFPISFIQLLTNDSPDQKDWEMAVDYVEKGQRKTPRLKLGDSVLGYAIVKVNKKNRKIYNPETLQEENKDVSELVFLKKGEEPVTLIRGERAPTKATYLLFYLLRDQYNPRKTKKMVAQAEIGFEVTGASDEKERYAVKEINEKLGLVVVTLQDLPEGQPAVEVAIPRFNRKTDFKRRKALD